MLFNSSVFIVFFLLVYATCLLGRNHLRFQNRMLLLASYVFYGAWDWRFLGLLLASTVVDYLVGRVLGDTTSRRGRRLLLGVSLLTNLSILGFFKYYGFFMENLVPILRALGLSADGPTVRIILPVGISFYTFQTLSYTFDIYRRRLEPTRDFFDFALFVAFFPQLVAGPIERASNLLPQIAKRRRLDAAQINAGLFLVLWGYCKKVAIADNVAVVANQVFNNYASLGGFEILVGILAFTVQIYCDFSGYSDIARGIAKLLGFDLMVNFRLPYFALDPSDFWARWHVSLSSWLRDYLYVALGGNRGTAARTYLNLMITMVLGGLWHGASWNFVVWGGFHGCLLIGYRLWDRRFPPDDAAVRRGGAWRSALRMALMFGFTLVGWVIFRSSSVDQILYMLSHVGLRPSAAGLGFARVLVTASVPLIAMQVFQARRGNLLAPTQLPASVRIPLYGLMLVGTFLFAAEKTVEFIYFQF